MEFSEQLMSAEAFPWGKVARREIAVTDEGRAIVISIELLPGSNCSPTLIHRKRSPFPQGKAMFYPAFCK